MVIDVYQIIKDFGGFLTRLNKQKVRKIPLGQFEKIMERKTKTRLSRESKEEIIDGFIESGEIKVITSRNGKKYVVTGKII